MVDYEYGDSDEEEESETNASQADSMVPSSSTTANTQAADTSDDVVASSGSPTPMEGAQDRQNANDDQCDRLEPSPKRARLEVEPVSSNLD